MSASSRPGGAAGILAIWNDCAPEGRELFERWYIREHLQERVGVPGFRFGRRYERVTGGDRQFMGFYEVDSPSVLASGEYVERLNDPTPWTREVMRSFRGMVRTVCDLAVSAGDLIGAYAVVLRADEAMAPRQSAPELVERMAEQDGIARVQLWTAAGRQTPADTIEMRARDGDRLTAGAFVVECLRRADAERVYGELRREVPEPLGISGAAVLGIYALLCVYPVPRQS